MKKITLFLFFLLSHETYAKRFANQYCEFELPPKWNCALEGTEWVCQSENQERKKEAIIVLAAKIRGTQDSLPEYEKYLKGAKAFKLPGGKTQVSESKYTKIQEIANHRWVDSLHLASEVPGFYTRYLATVKEDLGVVVSFSVSKDHYAFYQSLFDRMVRTLKVFRQKNADVTQFKLKGEGNLLEDTTFVDDEMMDIGGGQKQKKGSAETGGMDWLVYLIIIALVIVILRKLKKR